MRFILFAFLGSILSCTNSSNGVEVIPLPLNIDTIKHNNYTMNAEGSLLAFVEREKLFSFNITLKKLDSINLPIKKLHIFNLFSIKNDIVLLFFNQDEAYDTSKIRYANLIGFDKNLSEIYNDTLMVRTGYYFLEEDLNFVSGFYSDATNEYMFNDKLGHCLVLKNNTWDANFVRHKVVDPITGKIHELDQIIKKQIELDSNSSITKYIKQISQVRQFSIFDNKLVYYNNDKIYYINLTEGNSIDSLQNNANFNVCRRFEDGIYKVKGDTLWTYKLF